MNEELNRKLAEWRFPKATSIDIYEFKIWVHSPYGREGDIGSELIDPLFTHSLDACFKWLVPPIEGKGLTLSYVSFQQASGRYYAEWRIYREKDQVKCGELLATAWQEGTDLAEITALALCKAISKLIEQDVDTATEL